MNGRNDGLAELLVQLAGNAAALIEKAKAAQATRAAQTVDGEAVRRDPKEAKTAAADPGDAQPNAQPNAQHGALQDIIVQQAMRLHTLEAEVARLTAVLAATQAELAGARAAASPAAPPRKPKAKAPAKPKPKPAA